MAGMRFADVAELAWSHVRGSGEARRVTYTMGKTDKAKDVLLIAPAASILARYEHRRGTERFVFPLLDGAVQSGQYDAGPVRRAKALDGANAVTNKYLKRIAAEAGVEKRLSFHIARHSFADIALQAGWEVAAISKALAHGSLRQTEVYLSSLRQDVDERHRDLF